MLTVLNSHQVGFDTTEALYSIQRRLRQQHNAQVVAVKGSQAGRYETSTIISSNVFILQSRFEGMDTLRKAGKDETSLVQKLLAGSRLPGETNKSGSRNNDRSSPFEHGYQTFIGKLAYHADGQAQETDGPFPCLWMQVCSGGAKHSDPVSIVKSNFFKYALQNDERLSGIIKIEVFATVRKTAQLVQGFVPQTTFFSLRLCSQEAVSEVLPFMNQLLFRDGSLKADRVIRGYVDWQYHGPAMPQLHSQALELVRDKHPSLREEFKATYQESKVSRRRRFEAIRQSRERYESNRQTVFGCHGHSGSPRLKLSSPLRQRLHGSESSEPLRRSRRSTFMKRSLWSSAPGRIQSSSSDPLLQKQPSNSDPIICKAPPHLTCAKCEDAEC